MDVHGCSHMFLWFSHKNPQFLTESLACSASRSSFGACLTDPGGDLHGHWKMEKLGGKSRSFIPFSWTRMVVWRSRDWENGLIFSHLARTVGDSLWLVAIFMREYVLVHSGIFLSSGKWLHACTALKSSGTIDKYGMVHHRLQIMVDTCKDF